MKDEDCRAYWLAVLAKADIENVKIMLGFIKGEHKLGAFQVLFYLFSHFTVFISIQGGF